MVLVIVRWEAGQLPDGQRCPMKVGKQLWAASQLKLQKIIQEISAEFWHLKTPHESIFHLQTMIAWLRIDLEGQNLHH
jgi:hypothetical protein